MTSLPYIFALIGGGLIIYGLSPLAGTTVSEGLSERGCVTAIVGIAIFCAAMIAVVAS